MTAEQTNHARAYVMYIAMYMGLMRALYTAMYVRARRSRSVSPSAFNNRPMFFARLDLRAGVERNAGHDVVNLVPQCPALVPQSKCLTAGLAVVAPQQLTALVPQCPAINAYLARTWAHVRMHTRVHAHTRRMAQREVPRDCAGLTGTRLYADSMPSRQETCHATTRTIAIQDRNEERLVSRLWPSPTDHIRRDLAPAKCRTRKQSRQARVLPSRLPSLPPDAGRRGRSRRAVKPRGECRRSPLAPVRDTQLGPANGSFPAEVNS